MDLIEHCYSVLIVSQFQKFNQSILDLLPENRYSPKIIVNDVSGARRSLLENSYDIVIINTPLPDDFGTKLALDVCESSGTGVLLLVKSEHYPDINARVSPFGVLTLSKPTTAAMITQSLILLCGTRERLKRMEQKTASIEEKMEEIRLVNRAKWVLIDNLKMSENEAHKYIEKQAMNRCVTKLEIAKNILNTYR